MQKKNISYFALSLDPSQGHFLSIFYRPYYQIEYQYYKENGYIRWYVAIYVPYFEIKAVENIPSLLAIKA